MTTRTGLTEQTLKGTVDPVRVRHHHPPFATTVHHRVCSTPVSNKRIHLPIPPSIPQNPSIPSPRRPTSRHMPPRWPARACRSPSCSISGRAPGEAKEAQPHSHAHRGPHHHRLGDHRLACHQHHPVIHHHHHIRHHHLPHHHHHPAIPSAREHASPTRSAALRLSLPVTHGGAL